MHTITSNPFILLADLILFNKTLLIIKCKITIIWEVAINSQSVLTVEYKEHWSFYFRSLVTRIRSLATHIRSLASCIRRFGETNLSIFELCACVCWGGEGGKRKINKGLIGYLSILPKIRPKIIFAVMLRHPLAHHSLLFPNKGPFAERYCLWLPVPVSLDATAVIFSMLVIRRLIRGLPLSKNFRLSCGVWSL